MNNDGPNSPPPVISSPIDGLPQGQGPASSPSGPPNSGSPDSPSGAVEEDCDEGEVKRDVLGSSPAAVFAPGTIGFNEGTLMTL